MNGAFAFEGVTKRYGAETALAGLDLDGRPGECLALIGHNGAGKTTLMKLALGLLRPSEGAVRLLGVEPTGRDGATARRAVGFLPENVVFHDSMTGRESIAFYARLKRVPVSSGYALLERVGLDGAGRKRVKAYSKGMRQRLGLAQAMLGAPRLLLLDEPTGGLDPVSRESFYALIRERTAAGATVVLSSHVLTELEARTDRVAILREGRLVALGSLGELRRASALPLRIEVRAPESVQARLADHFCERAQRINDHAVELVCAPDDKMPLLRDLIGLGVPIDDIEIHAPTLDTLYAHYQGGKAAP
jgi:Cu-processing system ATP-binding protein